MKPTTEMIVVENRLSEILSYLPVMTNTNDDEFTVQFMYGDNKQLLDYLRQTKGKASSYPLIWLIYPMAEQHQRSKVLIESMQLVLAVETNGVMLNSERMKRTYEQVLIPLFNNLKKAFTQANIIDIKGYDEYLITKFPNYSDDSSNGEENQATYIWDALKVTFSCTLNANCLRPIMF